MKITLTKPQHEVSNSNKRFRVLVSGRRFGKTYLCITEMMKYATKVKQNIWYVAPTFKMAREIVWSKLKQMLSDFKWVDIINESNLSIKIKKTGSTISLKGCENYDSLRGVGIDFLILDEFADIEEKAWTEVLRASIADTKGDVLMCGSPKGYGNWSYRMYLKGKQDKEWDSFQFTTLQGGMVSKSEIEQAKQDIDIRTFRQEFEGTFENYAGAVYYNFHAVENVKEKKIDFSKPLHIGLDFNVDPMSASVAQVDKDIIHFVDEIVIYSSNTDEMVSEIKDRYGSKAKIIVYPDPACRQRKTSAGGRTDLSILQNAGFGVKCKLKHSPIRDRINAVNSSLKSAEGKRYIYVDPSCKIITKGLQRQIYKENTNIPDKEQGFDHMNDSIGYLVEIVKPLTRTNTNFKPQRWAVKQSRYGI
nr:terminase large subunit [uncultured Mediterranean phage uvMED]